MVSAINFAVRDFAGGTQHGTVAGDTQSNFIQVGSGDSVSLNLSRASVVAYEQQGADLLIKLVDGRTIVLSGYFNEAAGDQNHLYLSSDGEIVEVLVDETGNGVLFANYGPVEGWGKWSPLDDLRFTESDGVGNLVVASDDPAGQAAFIPGLLGGFGGAGLAAAGVGVAIIGSGGGGNGDGREPPTVNAQPVMTVTTNTTNPVLPVSGTGEPGDTVRVTIGGIIQTTTITPEGTWVVSFPGTGLPPDGNHTATVVVTPPTGDPIPLTGPAFVIDLTPPAVSVVHGTQSVNDIENLAEYANGVSIDGQGEPGASISVLIGSHTQTTTVATNGSWTVTFPQTQIEPGEYNIPVRITATDPLGNQTVINDVVVIDTVPHPITFNAVTSDNMVNLAESQSGLVVTGTSTAGATMTITLQGVVQTATVAANGTWQVTYPTGTLPAGEYAATLTATTTDAAGNASSATHSFQVDTTAAVSITSPVAGDNIVNASEAAGGVALSGTAQANSTVSVEWNGTTLPATTNASGVWTVTFPASAIRGGTYNTDVRVTGTDAQGNSATATHQIRIDTETAVAVNSGQGGGDDRISGAEAAAGIALTGTAEAGASVAVTFEGVTRTVQADASGNWTANYSAVEVRAGTYSSTVSVRATDLAGNTATSTHTIAVDTQTTVAVNPGQSGGDDKVSGAEAANGLVLTGTAEAGASVAVTFEGVTRTVIAGSSGAWTANFAASEVRAGVYTATVAVTATDLAGNTASTTHLLNVDTQTGVTVNPGQAGGDNLISGAEAASGIALTGTAEAGASVAVTFEGVTRTVIASSTGAWTANFAASEIRAGTYGSTVSVVATDALGNTATTTHNLTVDTQTTVAVGPGQTGGDNLVSGAEAASGIALTGTAEAGASVAVTFEGVTRTVIATSTGTWTANFAASEVRAGTYASTVTVRATDAAGNTATTSHNLTIDTQTSVAVNAGQAGGDNIVSGAEAASGLVLTGTAEAGASVAVTFAGFTRTVIASSTGAWTATYAASEVRAGSYAATVSVTATDAAGNTAATTHAINVDTEVNPFTRATLSTGTDTVVNAVEAAQGLTVTGMVEAGSTVVVRFGTGPAHNALVNAAGSWSLTIPASEIPSGEGAVTLTATATDRVGNVSTLSEQVAVDTLVRNFARTGGEISGDGMVNAEEAAAGLTLTGTVEPGASVVLRLSNGETATATVGSDGNWSAFFAPGQIPRGENVATTVTMTATDRAGNVTTLSDSFVADTVAPGSPEVISFSRDSSGLRAIGTETTEDTYTFARIDASGNTTSVAATRTEDTVFNETNFRFASTVPDGSYLVVNTADLAGNESSTLLIVNNTNALDVNLGRGGLAGFDFTAIDLTFAPEANLTITEAQLRNLTGPDQRLIIKGDIDDTVNLVGGTDAHQTRMIDGQTYKLFTLGTSGASVLVDDDMLTSTSTGV